LPAQISQRGARAITASPELKALRTDAAKAAPSATAKLSEQAPPLTEPILKETFSREVNGAVKDMLEVSNVKLALDIQIADQVRDLLQTNLLPPETFNEY
jgi:hypothetical protein